ncbi:flagellar hook assembly protein FlgD [Caulobacter vibrioides]|uniref:Basal-body rod modification protein FlgD n=3 Tax=Caulobacter vibrioides TaxID=155892 RepID=H7C7J5_CAUVC|nr:flagellar hook assembly protein FlgD [Caulobacter vibrioides]YP_002516319.1 Basal-body rod modification protein FlgD [Caulobacter vibrioides NA1000]AAC33328.1 putative scaffolding protein [Caulobacter vibrioides CB15]AAK22885.1 flagellar hook assembly protein FlgD, putative [Caulobacter vibrioides CB15]ACL94411.1 Basal-body rod modification protein FlgD [Caulobacter vibrioides NA1000]ATC27738.1 flagellar biosynthesis protein FlgD [Caulobacter vibrioides]QXZ52978.1 flagellar hook assembly p
MATAVSSQNTASVLDRINNSRTSLATNKETFLQLLTTQLKNQDPLSPTDTTQMTQQITQMTGVEQQLVTNDLLAALVGMNTGTGLSEGVAMIGKQVAAISDTSTLKDGKATFSWTQPSASASLKVEIKNASGKVVRTLTPEDQKSGDRVITWDGKDDSGAQLPNGGVYGIVVTAKTGDGKEIKATNIKGRTEGVVTAVDNTTGQPMVVVDGKTIPVDNVVGIKAAAA